MNSNQLILSTNNQFRQHHIAAAIVETLGNHEKVLFVTDAANLDAALGCAASAAQPNRVRILGNLAIEIAPDTVPFGAFRQWDVVITTPDYLRRQITLARNLLAESELQQMGLVVIDGFGDAANQSDQAILELGLIQLCLFPLDGILRRALITMEPVDNAADLAIWLRAEMVCNAEPSGTAARFASAWDSTHLDNMLLAFLAGQHRPIYHDIRQLAERSFSANAKLFDAAYKTLSAQNVITARNGLTTAGIVMARYGLSLADVMQLRKGMKLQSLSWLDCLLVAASCPNCPAILHETKSGSAHVDKLLAPLHSTLLQSNNRGVLHYIGIVPENLLAVQKIALVGYYTTRAVTPRRIAWLLDMPEAEVTTVIHALRVRIHAMVVMATLNGRLYLPQGTQLQILWHMLTGISPRCAAIAALPAIQHWVLERLMSTGITRLTDLIALTPERFPTGLLPGLLEHLQEQARALLDGHESEEAFVAAFTESFPVICTDSFRSTVA